MKNLFMILSLALLLGACKSPGTENETANENQVLISIDDFYANPDDYVGKEVTITGLVTHVCKHGGQKLFITGTTEGEALRIDVGNDIPEFDIAMEGTEAEFTGVVELMDEEFIAQAEAEHAQHHGEEEHAEEGDVHALKEKNYHLVAKTFKSL